MKIKTKHITIPRNYVLVLPDQQFENFQLKGRSSLAVGKAGLENVASHYSIRGKVYAVPDELVFNLTQIMENRIPDAPTLDFEQTMFYFKSQHMETEGYKKGSVAFDVPMEVRTGDVVYFNYQEHYNCFDQGRWVNTVEHGDMLLIKYDQLICCHPEKKPEELKMLNGYVFVEPISVETVFGNNVLKRAGIYLTAMTEMDQDFKKKMNIGYVVAFGRHCDGYIDFPQDTEAAYDFKKGQIVMYNSRVAPPLEFNLHKTFLEGKNLVKMRRRNIFAILPEAAGDGLLEDIVTGINIK